MCSTFIELVDPLQRVNQLYQWHYVLRMPIITLVVMILATFMPLQRDWEETRMRQLRMARMEAEEDDETEAEEDEEDETEMEQEREHKEEVEVGDENFLCVVHSYRAG